MHVTLFLFALTALIGLSTADNNYDFDLDNPPLCPGQTEPGCCKLEPFKHQISCGHAGSAMTIKQLKSHCALTDSTALCCIDFGSNGQRPIGCVHAEKRGKFHYPGWYEAKSRPLCVLS